MIYRQPSTPYIVANTAVRNKIVRFFICKLPPEDMQIRQKIPLEIDSTNQIFPMISLVEGNH
jgi:hypothetical protein